MLETYIIYQSKSKLPHLPPPPLPPGNPRVFEFFETFVFKFSPAGAKKSFKCPTIGPFQVIKIAFSPRIYSSTKSAIYLPTFCDAKKWDFPLLIRKSGNMTRKNCHLRALCNLSLVWVQITWLFTYYIFSNRLSADVRYGCNNPHPARHKKLVHTHE